MMVFFCIYIFILNEINVTLAIFYLALNEIISDFYYFKYI